MGYMSWHAPRTLLKPRKRVVALWDWFAGGLFVSICHTMANGIRPPQFPEPLFRDCCMRPKERQAKGYATLEWLWGIYLESS